jgi:serine/threonine protein kinase
VLITDDLSACLSDFGLSVLARDFELSTSSTFPCSASFSSTTGGSLRWAAPELFAFDSTSGNSSSPNANASRNLTLQTDVYSFGSVALQTFTGDVPYASVQNEMEVLLRYVVHGVPPERPSRLSAVVADEGTGSIITDVHWSALQLCWSPDPQMRPSSKALASIFV